MILEKLSAFLLAYIFGRISPKKSIKKVIKKIPKVWKIRNSDFQLNIWISGILPNHPGYYHLMRIAMIPRIDLPMSQTIESHTKLFIFLISFKRNIWEPRRGYALPVSWRWWKNARLHSALPLTLSSSCTASYSSPAIDYWRHLPYCNLV